MKLQLLLIQFVRVVLVESIWEVSGFLGDSVTLPSRTNSSWNLSSIQWSIFSNNTWIATYDRGSENLERVDRYKGRLSLNTSSGDLMIHKLTTEDAMEYSVDLINTDGQNSGQKTKLSVRAHLQTPTITTTTSSTEGGCLWWLHCSSEDVGVQLSLQPSNANEQPVTGNPAFLLVLLNTTQDRVEFTCTSSRNTEKASSVFTPTCDGDETRPGPHPQPEPQTSGRHGVVLLLGGLLGSLLTLTLMYVRERCKRRPEPLNTTL